MDINNDLQQINTFTKGMNTDVSDMLMDSSQYRYAENIRLVTNTDNNSGEVRLVDGTREYAETSDFGDSTIKAMTSVRNLLIVINNKDEIWVCDHDKPNVSFRKVFQPAEGESFGEYLSLVTRWETPNLIKLYIADGEHLLMYVNLCDGTTEHPITGIDNITANPAVFLGKLTATESSDSGVLGPTKFQYAYRRYKEGGASTTLSPLSNVVTLYKSPNEGYGITDPVNEGTHAIDVSFIFNSQQLGQENSTELKNILLFRLTYSQVGQIPTVDLVYDGPLPAGNVYTDIGTSVENMSFEELLEMVKMDITPKVIESKEDYLFAANVKYNQDELDLSVDIADEKCRAYSSGDKNELDLYEYSSYNKQFTLEHIHTFDPSYWHPKDRGGNTIGGDGEIFLWTYNDSREVYIDTLNNKYFMESGNLVLTEEQLSSLRSGEVYRYGAIFYDKKGNKTNVKWIADIMAPEQAVPLKVVISDKIYYKMHQTGILVKINNKQELLDADWAGVEIVRAVRTTGDKITITRGIGGYPYRIYTKNDASEEGFNNVTSTNICPTGFLAYNVFAADSSYSRGDNFSNNAVAITDPKYLMFASPEYAYSPETMKALLGNSGEKFLVVFKHKNTTLSSITTNGHTYNLPVWVDKIDEDIEDEEFGALAGYYTTVLSSDITRPFWWGLWKTNESNDSIGGHSFSSGVNFDHAGISQLINRQNYTYDSERRYCWTYNLDSALENYHSKQKGLPGELTMIYERAFNSNYLANNTMSVNCPYAETITTLNESPIGVLTIAYPEVPEWNSFLDETGLRAYDDVTPIGSDTYLGWSIPLLSAALDIKGNLENPDGFLAYTDYSDAYRWNLLFTPGIVPYVTDYLYSKIGILSAAGTILNWLNLGEEYIRPVEKRFPVFYPTGSTGQCIVMKLANKGKVSGDAVLSFPTIDIRKKAATPYGGRAQVDYTSYVSYGNIIDLTNNSTTIDIYDGDSYPGVFVYNASHAWYEPNCPGGVRQVSIYVVPLESDVDLSAKYGNLFTEMDSNRKYYAQDKACEILTAEAVYTQEKDAYWYNPAYGAIVNGLMSSSVVSGEIKKDVIDVRVHHSLEKKNGDSIDNWLDFRPKNYIDVDTRYGAITNLRLFKDKLLFWLQYGSGVLSVNERTVLNDIDANDIVVGTGGVLLRFDYISMVHGMKPNQYEAETQSNTTQYWWDGYNKELLAYSGGMELVPLNKVKSVNNHIIKNAEVAHPSLSYDVKFNELMASVVNGGVITYNEHVQQFTSIYTFIPIFRSRIGNDLLLTTRSKIYRWNEKLTSNPNISLLFGEPAKPKIQYVVNKANIYNKVFDTTTFGGRFYGGDDADLNNITFKFNTPLKQSSQCTGSSCITNREYDFRLAIPRNNNDSYGGRMRGKTMQCELSSSSNSTDFSLQYIVTKFRMSWS